MLVSEVKNLKRQSLDKIAAGRKSFRGRSPGSPGWQRAGIEFIRADAFLPSVISWRSYLHSVFVITSISSSALECGTEIPSRSQRVTKKELEEDRKVAGGWDSESQDLTQGLYSQHLNSGIWMLWKWKKVEVTLKGNCVCGIPPTEGTLQN